jgi:hypothetical protein
LSRRVIGARDEHDVGLAVTYRRDGHIHVEAEVVGAIRHQPGGLGAIGDDRVHRIRRNEPDRAAARATERL